MFELTGSVKYILPLMTAIMAAKWVADALNKVITFVRWFIGTFAATSKTDDASTHVELKSILNHNAHQFGFQEGIYDAHIGLNNYPFLDTKEEFHNTSKAAEVMRPQPEEGPLKVLLQEGHTVSSVRKP